MKLGVNTLYNKSRRWSIANRLFLGADIDLCLSLVAKVDNYHPLPLTDTVQTTGCPNLHLWRECAAAVWSRLTTTTSAHQRNAIHRVCLTRKSFWSTGFQILDNQGKERKGWNQMVRRSFVVMTPIVADDDLTVRPLVRLSLAKSTTHE